MKIDSTLARRINNAVLDLQSADLQSHPHKFRDFAKLLSDPSLEDANRRLTGGLDVDGFIADGKKTQRGMVGSARLPWPDDLRDRLGLTLLLMQKFSDDHDGLWDFAHTFYHSGSKITASLHNLTRQLIVPFARDYREFVEGPVVTQPHAASSKSNKVFIVHGHDSAAREAVARALERLDFEPVILHEQANQGRTVIEKVEAHGDVGFAVVLLTADDEGCVKGGVPAPRARQNVVLELGYFIGRLGRARVCTLRRGALEFPSDFAGVVWEEMDDAGAWKFAMARELKACGYNVDMNALLS